MSQRRSRALRGLAAIAVSLVLLPVGIATAQLPETCLVPGQVEVEFDGWTRIQVDFPPGASDDVVTYAVDPVDPKRLFATNGKNVMRSISGGCTWEEVLSLGSDTVLPFSVSATSVVQSIVISPAAHDTVYVIARERQTGFSLSQLRPLVYRSTEGGAEKTFDRVGQGLVGDPVELLVSESDPEVAYLATVVTQNAGGVTIEETEVAMDNTILFASSDSGVTWELVVPKDAVSLNGGFPPPLVDMAVDPLDPDSLWGVGNSGLWRSSDGGAHWTPEGVTRNLRVIDVFHTAGAPARILILAHGESWRSDDDGESWEFLPHAVLPSELDSVATGSGPDDIVAAVVRNENGWILALDPAQQGWLPIKFGGTSVMRDLQVDRATVPAFYARGDDHIWRSPRFPSGSLTLPPDPSVTPDPDHTVPPLPDEDEGAAGAGSVVCDPYPQVGEVPSHDGVPAELGPADLSVGLDVGASLDVPYEMTLPRTRTPLDLYFLISGSSSTFGDAACAAADAADDVAKNLVEEGIGDIWFGFGTYQTPKGSSPDCYWYQRDRNIAPLGPSWIEAFKPLGECSTDGPKPGAEALYQTATGEGLGPNTEPLIEPGLHPSFRAGSRPIIVHITDEPRPDEDPRGLRAAWGALEERGILQIGVAIQYQEDHVEDHEIDLNRSFAADDIIRTLTRHTFVPRDRVVFTSLTGGAGLTVNREYYVIAANLNHGMGTFQVSEIPDGSAVNFTTDITLGKVRGNTGEVKGLQNPSTAWLKEVALGTGTLASEPVDCEVGDDVVTGGPLVCLVPEPVLRNSTEDQCCMPIGDDIAKMIEALRDEAPVVLKPLEGEDLVESIDPAEHPAVNLKVDNTLPYDVTYRCKREHAGETIPVTLGAYVRDDLVAQTTTVVTCAELPPIGLSITNTHDANGDGSFTPSELAPNQGARVPFKAKITNTGEVPLTISALTQVTHGPTLGEASVCPRLVDTTLEPGADVACTFERDGYAPPAGSLLVNTLTVSAHEKGFPDRPTLGSGESTITTAQLPPEVIPELPPIVPPPIAPPAPPPPPPVDPPPPPPPIEPPAIQIPPTKVLSIQQPQPNPGSNPNPNPNPNPNAQTQTQTQTQQQIQQQQQQQQQQNQNQQQIQQQANPQAQLQANPQAQVQAGLAVQRQDQPQTAVARAYDASADYAMSARRDDPLAAASTTAALGAGALMLAYGCLSLRRGAQVARVRSHPRPNTRANREGSH